MPEEPPRGTPVEPYPPPKAMARILGFVTAGAAAAVGLLGCCLGPQNACSASLAAGVLALLSLVFNLWDFFQNRGRTFTQ